ncbi:hypothetical protein BJ322DRAFT_1013935 [Thelephora terrestris]|uniref:Uncharacterized protein n=1 Tax=Thelephora terrestris TaxID=56493 RepID=A0A9P6H663_9AGAM|nr:hypothetical protein BJ322DRAFT_1013935 [Thelephora terrestris]
MKRQRQPRQPSRRRYYVNYAGSGSEVEEIANPLAPPPIFEPVPQQKLTAPVVQQPAGPTIQQQLTENAIAISEYIIKVVVDAFRICRRVFSYALGIFILWFLLSMMTSQLVFFTRPVCSIPIVSPMIPFCRWDVFKDPPVHTSGGKPVWADYPHLVDLQTRTFDQLLDENVGNKGLALEVKKAEMASNDLITLVRVSDLRSKDQIAERLNRFVEDAKGTGRSLHSLGAKIHGAVDSIASLNDYALQTIEESKTPPSLAARVFPFAVSTVNPTKEAVLETFLMSMDNIGSQVVRLREEAEISMDHLLRLEEHLQVLHEITHRDDKDLTAAREDVLAELWTRLGGNRRKIRKADLNLNLLKNIDKYRKKALTHVVATLQTLHTLDADMEELRTRVAAPDIVGDKIPIEVHIKSIKAGVERLKEGQLRASLKQGESIAKILEIDS